MSDQISKGERIIRTTFNPSNDSVVQHIKERAAEMINYINDNIKDDHHAYPLKSKAIDAIELAAMYAVKAATV